MEQRSGGSGVQSWIPYTIPIAIFLVITFLEGQSPENYVWIYFAKIALTLIALIVLRSTWRDISFDYKWIPVAIAVGIIVFFGWVWLDKVIPYPKFLGERTAFNPFQEIRDEALRYAFLAVRFFGLVILVPVMEELFWRSFLLRYVTKPEFWTLRVGEFSWAAFFIVAGLFGLAHPEWLVAVLTAMAYALLLKYTRSLFACVVAHAVTNLALGVYVMRTGDWSYW